MKRTRHKRVPSPRRRALEIIAAYPDGCTEALLAAENIPADILIELVRSGLAIARNLRLDDEDGTVQVTTVWITEAGQHVLAARGSMSERAAFRMQQQLSGRLHFAREGTE
jgi:hypothetical protein